MNSELQVIIIHFKVLNIPAVLRGTEDSHVNLASTPGL